MTNYKSIEYKKHSLFFYNHKCFGNFVQVTKLPSGLSVGCCEMIKYLFKPSIKRAFHIYYN